MQGVKIFETLNKCIVSTIPRIKVLVSGFLLLAPSRDIFM
jgi:hypothetical protein